MKLASRLMRDFAIIDGEVVYKNTAHIKDKDGKEFAVPSEWFWILANKSKDGDMIVNASNVLTHVGCLNLAERCGIDSTQFT